MQNKTDPVDPRAMAFKLAVNHAEKQTVAALRGKKRKGSTNKYPGKTKSGDNKK